ncbi:hypothetical protein BDZ90DRAFT_230549 [Jaminaea rosea]|uniref:Tethering factor for nuclear proteasome STS1 n=1 Tax=Jaminaea rosea TaxID=1569628 RepID=A0A316V2P1_9BASI|nr:hypothetical protein BDZ90DRAFT_230549 [Jaminaea rosea]PWN29695.1 hypothetical protein BDZ90DRAFT_230549 [Jaminaea rosea]
MPFPYSASPLMTASKPSPPPTPHRNVPSTSSSSHDATWFQSSSASPATNASKGLMGWQSSPAVQWGSTPSLLPASVQWGSNTSFGGSAYASTSHQPLESPSHVLSPPDKFRKSESKRKRFEDEDEDEEMGGLSIRGSPSRDRDTPTAEGRAMAGRSLVPKRIRAGPGAVTGVDVPGGSSSSSGLTSAWHKGDDLPSANATSSATPASATASFSPSSSNIDLGKLLTSLDKANLLSLLSSLLSLRPELSSTIHSLLPIPTLESVNQSLDAYESDIKQALPFGSGSVRAEYAWNRLRSPVADMVAGIQGWMEFFRAKQEETSAQNEGVHPSTMFSLLLSITIRTIKIQRDLLPAVPSTALGMFSGSGEQARTAWSSSSPSTFLSALPASLSSPHSPNLIVTTLLPLLLGAWDALLGRISHDINVESKMLGREVVVSWFRGIEQLLAECEASKQQQQQQHGDRSAGAAEQGSSEGAEALRAIQGSVQKLGTQLKSEIGWTIGLY